MRQDIVHITNMATFYYIFHWALSQFNNTVWKSQLKVHILAVSILFLPHKNAKQNTILHAWITERITTTMHIEITNLQSQTFHKARHTQRTQFGPSTCNLQSTLLFHCQLWQIHVNGIRQPPSHHHCNRCNASKVTSNGTW